MATVTPDSPFGGSNAASSMPSTPVATLNSHPIVAMTKPPQRVTFTTEIQHMMHGLGDCRKPLLESSQLVESIVLQQLSVLLTKAEAISKQRNARYISIEDFIFLLRKSKVKLRRLIKYMELKDLKQTATRSLEDEVDMEGDAKPQTKKRKRICHDFVEAIDQTGELSTLINDESFVDEAKHSRNLRAEMQSRAMDAQEYKEFAEARQASFAPRLKTQKFKDWLMQNITLETKLSLLALEVLSYMAFETVAQVMDLSLIVKRDVHSRAEDPFSKVQPHSTVNYDTLFSVKNQMAPPQSTSVLTSLKSPAPCSEPSSPLTSPPSTPSTPANSYSTNLSNSTSSTKSKGGSKKKKKGNAAASRDLHTYNAVTPREIREAMRRYATTTGPFADFSKVPTIAQHVRLLCA